MGGCDAKQARNSSRMRRREQQQRELKALVVVAFVVLLVVVVDDSKKQQLLLLPCAWAFGISAPIVYRSQQHHTATAAAKKAAATKQQESNFPTKLSAVAVKEDVTSTRSNNPRKLHQDDKELLEFETVQLQQPDEQNQVVQVQHHHCEPAEVVETIVMGRVVGSSSSARATAIVAEVESHEKHQARDIESTAAAAADGDAQQEEEGSSTSSRTSRSSASAEEDELQDSEDDDLATERRQAAARAAMLAKRGGRTTKRSPKETSVGTRRVGSASKSRLQGTATSKLADAIRKTAQGTAASSKKKQNGYDDNNKPLAQNTKPSFLNLPSIHSTIDDMLETQKQKQRYLSASRTASSTSDHEQQATTELTAAFSSFDMPTTRRRSSMGILGEPTSEQDILGDAADDEACSLETPLYYPGAVILGPNNDGNQHSRQALSSNHRKGHSRRRYTVRVATPADDVPISSLRLSVFSHFTAAQQGQFCARSCQAIAGRRVRGATCLVASVPCKSQPAATTTCSSSSSNNNEQHQQQQLVVGSIECSFHEFFSTRLGQRRPQFSILYLTEVAVHPASRRQGIGRDLLHAVDCYAASRGVESLYLHVDVSNHGAIRLYEQAGYRRVWDRPTTTARQLREKCTTTTKKTANAPPDSVFMEFTKSLNLHPGATRGREHFLLCKDLTPNPTWLEERPIQQLNDENQWNSSSLVEGTFGFVIPA